MAEAQNYILAHAAELAQYTAEHITLTLISLLSAIIIGMGLGVAAFYWKRMRSPILLVTSVIQTIPGLALLALLLVAFKTIGWLPAVVALTLYALLPIVRATLTGLQATSPLLVESAKSLGLTRWQQIRYLRLPLAVPQLVSGIRVSANISVGLVTIAAFIGAGGLGQFINRGLFLSDSRLILLGAIPAALLAIALDALIGGLQLVLFSRRQIRPPLKFALLLLPLLVLFILFTAYPHQSKNTIIIGSKNFTEQLILGELLAQTVEENDFQVRRDFGLGGSLVTHQALAHNDIDAYVEYTGTALTAIFKQPVEGSHKEIKNLVCDLYKQYYHIHCLATLGFNNTYIFAMKRDTAAKFGISKLSQLPKYAKHLNAGFDFEFAARPDGYPRLASMLHLTFASTHDMEPGLMYKALAQGSVNIISAYSTDARMKEYDLVALKDDIGFFPPYEAIILGTDRFVRSHPDAAEALRKLEGKVNDASMLEMNYKAEQGKKKVEDVAMEFLGR